MIGGSLQLGDETLNKGDGFFVPAGTAYTFKVGPEGVEILEFRTEHIRDTIVQAVNNPAFRDKAVETIRTRREQWRAEHGPGQLAKSAILGNPLAMAQAANPRLRLLPVVGALVAQ